MVIKIFKQQWKFVICLFNKGAHTYFTEVYTEGNKVHPG